MKPLQIRQVAAARPGAWLAVSPFYWRPSFLESPTHDLEQRSAVGPLCRLMGRELQVQIGPGGAELRHFFTVHGAMASIMP
eukprot:1142291-Pelagomonas_calceolata.AAC.1